MKIMTAVALFDDLPKEFFYYAVTSLIGSAIGVIFGFFWKEKVVPFMGDLSEGTKIHPEWKGKITLKSDKVWDATLTIKKLGKKISGELQLLTGESAGKKYTIEGRFDNGMLTFLYIPADKNSISKAQGAVTLARMNDGERLEGYFAFGTDKHNVGSATGIFFPRP